METLYEVAIEMCELAPYTEAVSPDNGKLKLRVSKAVSGSNPNRVSPDYREDIVWDEPIRWTLCN